MAQYNSAIITNQGLILADKAIQGTASYEIKKVTGSTTNLNHLSEDEIKNLTTIQDDSKIGKLVDKSDGENDNISNISIIFDNKYLGQSYYLNSIGIWATDNKTKETILYAVITAAEPESIPSFKNKDLMTFKLNVVLKIGNKANVTIVLDNSSNATIGYVDRIKKEYDVKLSDVQEDIDQKVELSTDESITGSKNFTNGLKISDKDLYVKEDKLYYEDKPVLVANAPNAPKLELTIDKNNNYIQYQVIPSSVSGGAEITGYVIYWKKQAEDNWQSKELDKDDLIGELKAEKSNYYDIKVIAKNYAGNSAESEIYSILSADVPIIKSISITPKYPDIIEINPIINDMGGNIKSVIIYYKEKESEDWLSFSSENIKTELKGKEGKSYDIKAKANNAVGFSDDSITYTAQTIVGTELMNYPTLFYPDSLQTGIGGSYSLPAPYVQNKNKAIITTDIDISEANFEVTFDSMAYMRGNGDYYFTSSRNGLTLQENKIYVSKKDLDYYEYLSIKDNIQYHLYQSGGNTASVKKELYISKLDSNHLMFSGIGKDSSSINFYSGYGTTWINGTYLVIKSIIIK